MKAIVKKIKLETEVNENNHHDIFTEGMDIFIGEEIDVEPLDGCKDWYICTDSENGFTYHSSWLIFPSQPSKHVESQTRKKELRTTQRWYKPSKRLPEEDQKVFVLRDNHKIYQAFCEKILDGDELINCWNTTSDLYNIEVLLWSPIVIPKI